MTATIRPPDPRQARRQPQRRKRVRFSSMEALGFIDAPTSVTNTWTTAPASTVAPKADPQPRPRKRGAHERTLADVEPYDTTEYLIRKNFRWGLAVVMTLLVGTLIAAGIWLWQRPAALAETAVAEVTSAASALEPELAALADVNATIAEPEIDPAAVTSQANAVDNQARALFNAAGTLPDGSAEIRANAADAATAALDASRTIADAVAYRSAVINILVAPALETDPELIPLDEAVRSFGTWRLAFDQVRAALPTGTMSRVTSSLEVVSGDLESIQNRYIDALREDDAAAATTALSELTAQLSATEQLLWSSLEEAQSRADELITESTTSLSAILP